MAKKPTLSDVANVYTLATTINSNNDRIEEAFENTLSRDGSTPNQMGADIDLNSNDLLNVNRLDTQQIFIGGEDFSTKVIAAEDYANLAEAWAESPTSPDGDPDSQSAKTWAGEAEQSANTASEEVSKIAGVVYPSRSAAILASPVAPVVRIGYDTAFGTMWFKRDTNGTALTTADGSKWSPDGDVNVLHFGNYSASNNSPAAQAAANYMVSAARGKGGAIHIPDGSWPMATTVTVDLTAQAGLPNTQQKRVFFKGGGKGSTVIKAQTDNMKLFRFVGPNPITSANYAYGDVLEDMSLAGNSPTSRSTYGVELVNLAFWSFSNVGGFNLNTPVILTGALSGTFNDCDFRENTNGVTGTADASHVNAIMLVGTRIQVCTNRGINISGGCSNITMIGGSLEGCGTQGDATTGGIYLEGSGSQGEVSFTSIGAYIEINKGGFDLKIVETGGNKLAATCFGTNFQRASSSAYTTNNIVTEGKVILSTVGCTFSKGNTYVANAARPYIKMGVGGKHISTGDRYEDEIESPRRDASEVYSGFVTGSLGASVTGNLPRGWAVVKLSDGLFRITHNLNTTLTAPIACVVSGNARYVERLVRNPNSFDVKVVRTADDVPTDDDFSFMLTQYGGAA